MGHDRYRYLRFKSFKGNEISLEAKTAYEQILPVLFDKVTEWSVLFDTNDNALEIKVEGTTASNEKIQLPKEFGPGLCVGWNDNGYGSYGDPKEDIANKIMNTWLGCHNLLVYLKEDYEDFIAEEAGCYDDECDDSGLYQGYDDWEEYCDAYGIEQSNE